MDWEEINRMFMGMLRDIEAAEAVINSFFEKPKELSPLEQDVAAYIKEAKKELGL